MNKPTICFITDAFISDLKATITGPMVQTYQLGKELKKRGWNVHFISYSKENKKGLEIFEDLPVTWIPYQKYFFIFYLFRIYKNLKKIKPDYCYQRGRDPLTGLAAFYCRMQSKKFVWASAGESGVLRNKHKSNIRKKKSFIKRLILFPYALLLDSITEYGIRNANQIIVQTAFQQDLLMQEFGLPGIIIKSGHPVPDTVTRELPIKLLWIGSIKPVKQPELFIDLARRCSNVDCEFIIAGQMIDRKYGEQILELIRSTPNVRYAGVIPFRQSQQFISQAHALINTTQKDYEGLPNAFVQAWLTGTITISLECDPDGVIEKYGLGIYTPSIENMAEFIRSLTLNRSHWSVLSDNARNFAIKNYSIESIVNRLVTAIE